MRGSLTYPNGVVSTYSYVSDRDWLAGITTKNSGGTDLLTIGYPSHDLVGNRTARSENGTPISIGYDDTYQVTSAGTEQIGAVTPAAPIPHLISPRPTQTRK